MARLIVKLSMRLMLALLLSLAAYAQHPQRLLTNDDVIAMVHKKLPESVIVSAIEAGPSKFNTSSNELIRLNAAGLTEKELNAMLAAAGGSSSGPAHDAAATSAPDQSAAAMPASKS